MPDSPLLPHPLVFCCCFIFFFVFCYYQKFQQCIIKSQGTLVTAFSYLVRGKIQEKLPTLTISVKKYACQLLLREVCF